MKYDKIDEIKLHDKAAKEIKQAHQNSEVHRSFIYQVMFIEFDSNG